MILYNSYTENNPSYMDTEFFEFDFVLVFMSPIISFLHNFRYLSNDDPILLEQTLKTCDTFYHKISYKRPICSCISFPKIVHFAICIA